MICTSFVVTCFIICILCTLAPKEIPEIENPGKVNLAPPKYLQQPVVFVDELPKPQEVKK